MIAAFNSVYTALQGFFSRSFWFATFLPVALFAVLHAAVASVALPSGRDPVKLFGIPLSIDAGGSSAQLVTAAPFIIVALVIIGYALTPLMPLFRGLLDGSLLPSGIHDWLRNARQAEATRKLGIINAARDDLGQLLRMHQAIYSEKGDVRVAYAKAIDLKGALDEPLIAKAEEKLTALRAATVANGPMSTAAADAQQAVLAVLEVNNPDANKLKEKRGVNLSDADRKLVTRTNDVGDQLEELLGAAYDSSVYRFQFAKSRCRISAALAQPRATAIGDARFVVERYAWDVYQVDFDFLWPRLLVAMKAEKAEEPTLMAIDNARCQVDFAVLSLALALTIPLVWLPVLLLRGQSPWLFLAIGAATPLLLGFFYRLTFEAQLAFGELVKTSIDKSRFLVLKMLRQPEPLTRSDERALWVRVAGAETDGRLVNLIYTPPKPP